MRKTIAIILLLAPSLLLAADNNPKAVIETTMGNFNCTLFKDKAP